MTHVDVDFLDWQDARREAVRAAARERAWGNFPPFYVRRIGAWGAYTPAAQVYFGRWSVFHGMIDLNNAAPDWARLGTFWRFGKACRVAHALQSAFQEGERAEAAQEYARVLAARSKDGQADPEVQQH